MKHLTIMCKSSKDEVMQNKTLFISPKDPKSGMPLVTLGVMELLKRRIGRVAFFKPLILDKRKDKDIDLILSHFKLKQNREDAGGLTLEEAVNLLSQGEENLFYEKIIEKLNYLQKNFDFILCQGIAPQYVNSLFDYDINLKITKNIASPFMGVIKGKDKSFETLKEEIKLWFQTLKNEKIRPFTFFVNKVTSLSKEEKEKLKSEYDIPIFFIPENIYLSKPSVIDVKSYLNLKALNEDLDENLLLKTIMQYKIAAMRIDHFLEHLEEGDFIITPGDRSDILLAALDSNEAKNFPSVSGILLTGGLEPEGPIKRLLKGMKYFKVPILKTEDDTYTAAMKATSIPTAIHIKNRRKIALAIGHFFDYVDTKKLRENIKCASSSIMTPAMFEFMIFEKARSKPMKIILPESDDERILFASEIILNRNLAKVYLLGDKEEILNKAESLGVDIKKASFIDQNDKNLKNRLAKSFHKLRACKGVTYEKALDMMENSTYFATMLVYEGIVDGMVSGATHTTRETIKPALEIIKTKEGISRVSSVFFMCLDTRVLVYGDCAVNTNPNASQLAQIAISSADTAKEFSIEPIVAMLSYSSGDSGVGEDVEKVREATKIAKSLRPDLLIDGPMQYDTAIDPEVAKRKMPKSPVAGRATVFIFPDLNTGNNTYKAVQRSTGAIAIGPVLQGLRKPVNDLSRGCSVDDIVSTVAITAVQAQGVKK